MRVAPSSTLPLVSVAPPSDYLTFCVFHKFPHHYIMRKPRCSKGKQKIEIKKIEAEDARAACFSKRKSGIFTKASELATLCGAKVGVLIDSPSGRPYTFGCPSLGHVIDLFFEGGTTTSSNDVNLNKDQRLSEVQKLNNNLMQVGSNIKEAKTKRAMLISRIADLSKQNEDVWRIENAQDMNLAELKKAKETLERFTERIKNRMINKPELGSSANDLDPGHGKGIKFDLNLDLNLFPDVSSDHVEQMNTYINSNGNDGRPSEAHCDLKDKEMP